MLPAMCIGYLGAPREASAAKPILFYGTSITHGACASRPGMVHTAILGRHLDRPVINLGFSGNGRMEKDQTQIGLFWNPPIWAAWNRIAETAALGHPGGLSQDARTFAALNLTFADTVIAELNELPPAIALESVPVPTVLPFRSTSPPLTIRAARSF